MGIPAFTNAVGSFTKRSFMQGTSRTWFSFGYEYTSNDDGRLVATNTSGKSETIHGNRRSAFPYTRNVVNLYNDSPFVQRQTYYNNGKVEWFTESVKPYSLIYEPGSIGPPVAFYERASNAYAGAVTRARNNLKDMKVENGAAIGEARQTANQIAETYKTLLHAFQAARRGMLSEVPAAFGVSARSLLSGEVFAKRWLEYIYGWLPLMSDIYDNYKLITHILTNKTDQHFRSTGGYSDQVVASYDDGQNRVTNMVSLNARVVYDATIVDEVMFRLDEFGLANPASVAWELSPYSFVIDWFVPVGQYLSALSATLGLGFSGGFVSEKYFGRFRAHRIAPPGQSLNGDGSGLITSVSSAGEFEVQYFRFNRTPLAGFEMPQLYGKKNPFSTTHVLSAIALARQTFGS